MGLFENKKRKKHFKLEYIWITILVFYLFFLGIRGAWHQHKLVQRYRQVIAQIEAAKELNLQQKRKLSRLQDLRYLEFLARDRLGLVKPGEKVYKLIAPEGGVKK